MTCVSCNGHTVTIWQEGDYSASQCLQCTLIQADGPMPPALFDASYYLNNYSSHDSLRVRHFQNMLHAANVTLQPPVLDIGAGMGFFLKSLLPAWRQTAAAVEPSLYARQRLMAEAAAPTVVATMEELPASVGPFATVTLWDVLAHVQDPIHLLLAIREQSAAQGMLIIKTPQHPPFLFQMARLLRPLKKGRALLHIPSQRFHFTPRSLERLLIATGFVVEQVQWVNEVPAPYNGFARKLKEATLQTFLRLSTRNESFLCVARKQP